jgi:hypothetical protein
VRPRVLPAAAPRDPATDGLSCRLPLRMCVERAGGHGDCADNCRRDSDERNDCATNYCGNHHRGANDHWGANHWAGNH